VKSAPTTAKVSLKPTETGGFELVVALAIDLDMEQEAAVTLVKTAHQVCPYSNATRGNIEVALSVNGHDI
jgi:osmotically inducible protein OsmC